MRSSLASILPWATGPVPELCMGVLAIALGDVSIPVEERIQFLEAVLQGSPNEAHQQELESLIASSLQAGHFPDVHGVFLQISTPGGTVEE